MNLHANAEFHAQKNGRPAFNVGQRVAAHPGTDCFMQGDRCGTVAKVGRALVHVRMDRSQRVLKFHPGNLENIV